MGTLKLNIHNMKHTIFCILALFVAFSTVTFADDHANACTEADNPTEYAICQTLETYCATTIAACSGESTCLSLVSTVYDTYAATFSLAGVTDCECASFTCDENFTQSGSDDSDNSGAGSLMVSAGFVGLMKIFA